MYGMSAALHVSRTMCVSFGMLNFSVAAWTAFCRQCSLSAPCRGCRHDMTHEGRSASSHRTSSATRRMPPLPKPLHPAAAFSAVEPSWPCPCPAVSCPTRLWSPTRPPWRLCGEWSEAPGAAEQVRRVSCRPAERQRTVSAARARRRHKAAGEGFEVCGGRVGRAWTALSDAQS